jgi:glycosyltransferase involved in cell wall biosynthesis
MCVDNGGLEAERIISAGGKIEFLSRNVSRYGTFLNERSVVLVNTHYSEFGLDLAAKRSIPVVATIHNAYVWFGKTERDAFRANDGKVAHYISVSSNVKRYLVDRLGVADNKVTIVPNGVDTVRLSLLRQLPPKVTRDSLGIGPNDFVFLNIASLDGRKNHHAIISAVERLVPSYPNLKVICAGNVVSPPYFEGLKRRVALSSLEERILFPGFIRPVADLYRLADAFLLPSIVEGWSMAMTEAMYFGLPMVLTDVGGARDVLDKPGMGVLVSNSFGEVTALSGENLGQYTEAPSPSNLDELCEAMQDMMSRYDDWRGFAEERRRLVESEYTLEKMIKETVSIFSNYL